MKGLIKKDKIVDIREIPYPKEKKGYSIIKVKYMGICKTDIDVIKDDFPIDNIVVGHEVSGNIVQSEIFNIDEYVGINPYTKDGMHGLTESGYFSEYISVKNEFIFPIGHHLLATYLEPVAASLLNIENETSVAVYGKGRIPNIIYNILKRTNPNVELIYKDTPFKEYNLVVQAETGSLNEIMKRTASNGTIILRSRTPLHEVFDTLSFIKKGLHIEASYYTNFNNAVKFINENEDFLMNYMGKIYKITKWKDAIIDSASSPVKIFMEF